MKIDLKLIIIGILLAILGFSTFKCSQYKQKFDAETLKNQTLDSVKNALGQIVYQQQVQIVSDQEGFKKYTDSMFNLSKQREKQVKEVLAYYKSLLSIKLENLDVPYVDVPALKKKWEDSIRNSCQDVINYYEANTLIVPKEAKDSTQFYNLSFTVGRDSLKVNKIELIDSQYIRFVTIKGGLFKKDVNGKFHIIKNKEVVAQVLHTNPYVKVRGQESALFSPPKKNRTFERVLMLGAGIFLGLNL